MLARATRARGRSASFRSSCGVGPIGGRRVDGASRAAKLSDWLRSENEGDPIVVTVDDPEAAASDWQRALSKADVTHAMSFEFPDQIRVFLPITRTSIELLRDRNIEVPAGEWWVLLIQAMRNNRP